MSALVDEPGDPGILQSALGGVLRDPGVLAAALVDIDSGMALETYASGRWRVDPEVVAAGQADIVRATVDTMRSSLPVGPPTEVVVNHRDHLYHVLQTVPDPYGDRLALALVVSGPARSLRRVRRRLRRVDPAALVPPRPAAVQRREGPLIPDRSAVPARATAATPPTDPRDGALLTASLGGGPGAEWPAGPTRWVGDPAPVVPPTGPTAAGAPPAQRIGTSVSGQPVSLPAVGPQGRSAADGHLLRRPAHPAQDTGAASEGIGPVSAPQAGPPAPHTAAPRTTTTAPYSTGPAHRVVGTAPQPAVGTSPGDFAGVPRSGVPAPHAGPTAPRTGESTAHAAAPGSAASVQRPAGSPPLAAVPPATAAPPVATPGPAQATAPGPSRPLTASYPAHPSAPSAPRVAPAPRAETADPSAPGNRPTGAAPAPDTGAAPTADPGSGWFDDPVTAARRSASTGWWAPPPHGPS